MKPAARLADLHACPLVTPGTPPVPHVGGPITAGYPTVLIGGMPAARAGDVATCVGPPDTIVLGSMTVQIGNRLAARLGDMTSHGGAIVVGCPTVLIGDGAFPYAVVPQSDGSIRVGNHLIIRGAPEYQARVLAHLSTIAMTTNPDGTFSEGRSTLDTIDGGGHDVTIRSWNAPDHLRNECVPDSMADAQDPAQGSASTIYFNPDHEPPTAANPAVNRPSDVGLHHELGHAGSVSGGAVDLLPATNANNPHMEEETNIDRDNQYRTARGVPNRVDHTTL
jgi:uncharacterized Zn-binding protein involved in type VI secretion